MSAPVALPAVAGTGRNAAACPVCGGGPVAEVESAAVRELARAWARQGTRTAERVEAEIRADLGADPVRFLGCAACGVEFAQPMRAWSAGHYPEEAYGIAYDHLRALDLLAARPPLDLLEVGCADGKFLERAAALGHRATGIDFDARAIAAARGRGVDAHVGDVAALVPLIGERRFGAIAMFQIIEHLTDPHAVFAQLAGVAAPGALLLLGCPSDRRYTRRLRHPERVGGSDFWDWPPQHTLRWSERSLRRFLALHGWRVERVEPEPLSLVGAAAHVTALRGAAGGWMGRAPRRRVETARALAELAVARARNPLTGIRLFVAARREG